MSELDQESACNLWNSLTLRRVGGDACAPVDDVTRVGTLALSHGLQLYLHVGRERRTPPNLLIQYREEQRHVANALRRFADAIEGIEPVLYCLPGKAQEKNGSAPVEMTFMPGNEDKDYCALCGYTRFDHIRRDDPRVLRAAMRTAVDAVCNCPYILPSYGGNWVPENHTAACAYRIKFLENFGMCVVNADYKASGDGNKFVCPNCKNFVDPNAQETVCPHVALKKSEPIVIPPNSPVPIAPSAVRPEESKMWDTAKPPEENPPEPSMENPLNRKKNPDDSDDPFKDVPF